MPEPTITTTDPAATPVATPPAAPTSYSTFKDAFAAKFESDIKDIPEDDLVKSIETSLERASLLEANEDADTLRSYREAAAWRQQAAGDWDNFQEWKKTQSAPAEPEKPAADAWKPKYSPVKVDPADLQYLERDERSGLFRAKLPELAPRAEAANRMLQYRQQVAEEMYSDPYGFGQEITRPMYEQLKVELRKEIEAIKAQMTPIQEAAQMSALEAFERQNAALLFRQENGATVWTEAGAAYDNLIQDGLSPQKALEHVKKHYKSAPVEAPVPGNQPTPEAAKTPETVKKAFTARAKAASRSTGQPSEQSNTVKTAINDHDSQNLTRMTAKARWKAAAEIAQREVLEGQAS